jgi:mRNA interferase RelE/StbE
MTDRRYSIDLAPAANRQLAKLARSTQRRLSHAIDRLSDDPRPAGATILAGTRPMPIWRIRVGDHRVLYHIHDERLLVLVLRVGHRADVYRGRQVSEDTPAYADEVLADRTTFVLPAERWDAFVELLEREPRPMPGLAAFLARPSILQEE